MLVNLVGAWVVMETHDNKFLSPFFSRKNNSFSSACTRAVKSIRYLQLSSTSASLCSLSIVYLYVALYHQTNFDAEYGWSWRKVSQGNRDSSTWTSFLRRQQQMRPSHASTSVRHSLRTSRFNFVQIWF